MKHKTYKKVVLVILDGFGVASSSRGNAISQAAIPTLNYIADNFPAVTLQASGPLVGLPWGEMGNSEVGHLNIGAGRIVGQDLPRITASIQSGDFFKNPAFLGAVEHVKKNHSSLHVAGLVSGGGVHSLDEHLYALLGLAAQQNLPQVYIHMFTDGRDTDPKVALESIKKLRERIARSAIGEIATITGRFYAMDRGQHWNQTMMMYAAIVSGVGQAAVSAEQAVEINYQRQIFDEMIPPTVIANESNRPVAKLADNDAIIFFNFRSDRALQLAQVFVAPENMPQELRPKPLQNIFVATMTEYFPGLKAHVAFGHMDLKNNLAEVLATRHLTQFHIAESEKYAHVTAFFNCGRAEKWPGEERVIVSSPENSRNYVDHPEMSAPELTQILVKKISDPALNFAVANFANTDMVGHTGNLMASIKAVTYIDGCLKQIMQASLQADAVLLITADHGNVEQMINTKSGDIDKDHTTNPVPFLIIANELKFIQPVEVGFLSLSAKVPVGAISDIAPTILGLMGLPKPVEMTGVDLMQEI